MKPRKLKARINMDNDWMYRVYLNRGQGSITLGVIFYVCGPTPMELIPHLGFLKKWYMHGHRVDVSCIKESGPRAHNSWIKIP